MSDCRFGVSPVNHPDPDPDPDVCEMPKRYGYKMRMIMRIYEIMTMIR